MGAKRKKVMMDMIVKVRLLEVQRDRNQIAHNELAQQVARLERFRDRTEQRLAVIDTRSLADKDKPTEDRAYGIVTDAVNEGKNPFTDETVRSTLAREWQQTPGSTPPNPPGSARNLESDWTTPHLAEWNKTNIGTAEHREQLAGEIGIVDGDTIRFQNQTYRKIDPK